MEGGFTLQLQTNTFAYHKKHSRHAGTKYGETENNLKIPESHFICQSMRFRNKDVHFSIR